MLLLFIYFLSNKLKLSFNENEYVRHAIYSSREGGIQSELLTA